MADEPEKKLLLDSAVLCWADLLFPHLSVGSESSCYSIIAALWSQSASNHVKHRQKKEERGEKERGRSRRRRKETTY